MKVNRYNQLVASENTSEQKSRKRESEQTFTFQQRLGLWFISNLTALAIWMICSTLRFEVSSEDGAQDPRSFPERKTIATFWHRGVFTALYYFRHRGISVMTSRSYDGEYIAGIASRFGLLPVRGSSSRGAVSALLGMFDVIEDGGVAAFTIDGPRGPKYVAKPGPILLAKKSGAPIRCFYIAVAQGWTLRSWDDLVIPRPFSQVHIRWSAPLTVPADADQEQMTRLHEEMQRTLERVTAYAQNTVESQL